MESDEFSILLLLEHFEGIYKHSNQEKEIPTDVFLKGFRELSKLFDLLGKAFYFVKVFATHVPNP